MKRRKNYMVVHRDPDVIWDKVEENWSKMVHLEPATWLRTYYNADFQISWESILAVEETIPDIWARTHQAQMDAEEREDTVTSSKRLAREGTS